MPRAGLDAGAVTEAGAALADEAGFAQLSMSLVAERLGVRTPSLYKHVDGLGDLARRICVLAVTEMGAAVRDATQGRARRDALEGAAQALRGYVKDHPGRYAATVGVRPTGPDDPLAAALERALTPLSAVLLGYRLDPAEETHAVRMLRSMLHGFAALEISDGFQMSTNVNSSFTWMIDFIDQGLRAAAADVGHGREVSSQIPPL
ncbi:TetR/AcrR family transcriptional regulator [Arthrobacter crusticola]|uniref:TetR/AcrR family transcriptional regulator n=1 Tax=Arthrobacter crusticola TaxID=2547960 RepID=A0A4R5TTF1_9MICC|nr:TetR/AcrR family transcriptional regulator [Arthrobacter crusticola]TDK23666.1 TetR/AcrR family transcriptional regulator [Arthrobacter crusticola]